MIIVLLCPRQLAFFGAVSSGRCGAAELRARMSPLMRMAAERAEHEQAQVQMQVQVRARMPLLPPRCCMALAAAMRIARKRNRSPQNGAGRDDGSSQCSLL